MCYLSETADLGVLYLPLLTQKALWLLRSLVQTLYRSQKLAIYSHDLRFGL